MLQSGIPVFFLGGEEAQDRCIGVCYNVSHGCPVAVA